MGEENMTKKGLFVDEGGPFERANPPLEASDEQIEGAWRALADHFAKDESDSRIVALLRDGADRISRLRTRIEETEAALLLQTGRTIQVEEYLRHLRDVMSILLSALKWCGYHAPSPDPHGIAAHAWAAIEKYDRVMAGKTYAREELDPLRKSVPKWRVGRKLGRTLYKEDACVGMVDTPELATEIVARMNEIARPSRGLACETCLGARVICYRDMKAVPCHMPNELQCPNTGHHPCLKCYLIT
jgi:hypothetical protein